MANVNITLNVNVQQLQTITQNGNLGTDNSWATVTQVRGTPIPDPGGDPAKFKTVVHKDDVITWKGLATGDPDPTTGSMPVIHITDIEFLSESAKFGDKIIEFPHPTDPTTLEGCQITYTALQSFPIDAPGPVSYTIHFSIGFKHRLLDPKIKIIPSSN